MKRDCAAETPPSAPVAWRLLVDGALSGRENMDADARSLEAQKSPDALPTLRFFLWARPTVSYGRLQDPAWAKSLASPGVETVRRPTGGGAVRHDKDLSFSLAWRRDHPALPKCLKDVYRTIHRTVAGALAKRGVITSFYVKASTGASAPGVCFVEPAEDDLMWNGRKILGGALRVTGWGRLYQGNLLTAPAGLDVSETVRDIAAAFEEAFRSKPAR